MATIVSRALRVIDRGRQKLVDVGLRPTRVWIRTAAWSEELLLGRLRTDDVEIVPRPLVEGSDERLRVDNVTPQYVGGGWSPDDLQPPGEARTETFYMVQQAGGPLVPYRLVELGKLDAFRYTLSLERISRTNPEDFPSEDP